MKYTLSPALNVAEKRELETYLVNALAAPEHCYALTPGAQSAMLKLSLYRDGRLYTVKHYDFWHVSTQICIGRYGTAEGYNSEVSMKERLMILIALSGYLGERSVWLEAAIKRAVLKHLMGEYSEIKAQTIIEADKGIQQDGIAVNEKDGQVAFLLADTWMLPSGETVNVEAPEWEVYANKFPVVEATVATEAPTVDDVQF